MEFNKKKKKKRNEEQGGKVLQKLMINAVYGKTMGKLRKKIHAKLKSKT